MATIHYLQWHEAEYRDDDARELYINLQGLGDLEISEEQFEKLYKQVGQDELDSAEEAFAKWNAGSGRESDSFINAETRSLSVGDIVEIDGSKYLCKSIGWEELDF